MPNITRKATVRSLYEAICDQAISNIIYMVELITEIIWEMCSRGASKSVILKKEMTSYFLNYDFHPKIINLMINNDGLRCHALRESICERITI